MLQVKMSQRINQYHIKQTHNHIEVYQQYHIKTICETNDLRVNITDRTTFKPAVAIRADLKSFTTHESVNKINRLIVLFKLGVYSIICTNR